MLPVELMAKAKRLDLGVADKTEGDPADRVLSAFDTLAEAETLLLRGSADLRPHFERLSALRAGLFRWSLLEQEKGADQVLITRLRPKDGEWTVGGYFGRDHDEIDILLEYAKRDLEGAARTGGAPPATLLSYFEEFSRRLERHIRWEEELLFPAVESGAPQLAAGPGRVMRLEHEDIRQVITQLHGVLRGAASAGRVPAEAEELLKKLQSLLAAHNLKEEGVYYPLADRRLQPEESGRLLSKVRLR